MIINQTIIIVELGAMEQMVFLMNKYSTNPELYDKVIFILELWGYAMMDIDFIFFLRICIQQLLWHARIEYIVKLKNIKK